MFSRVLIANRAEIAVRIARTLRRMGITAIAVYSDADRGSMHVRTADEAFYLGPSEARLSYLNVDAILEAARQSGAEAIHPGYGFLSENAGFARAVQAAGLTWIGPSPEAISALGDKAAAKALAIEAGVPVVPGYDGANQNGGRLKEEADRIGYPVLIKALAGGGGRGMREVHEPGEFDEALASARREALSAFGDERVLLERLITGARHVEVQVFGDSLGNLVHLGERDCSIQRRHQKVIEEAPSPAVDEQLRANLGAAAIAVARRAGYTNAGTVEFLLDANRKFYFLEVNTRLQVEHPVTELITGLDLVEWQLRVAAGEPLPLRQDEIKLNGHAIEARIYAEDPYNGFLPSTGTVGQFGPVGNFYFGPDGRSDRTLVGRLDAGYETGDVVSSFYDALLGKLVSWGPDRVRSLTQLRRDLEKLHIPGVVTNLPLLRAVAGALERGEPFDTESLEPFWASGESWPVVPRGVLSAALVAQQMRRRGEANSSPWLGCSGWRLARGPRPLQLAMEGHLFTGSAEPLISDPDGMSGTTWRVSGGEEADQVAVARAGLPSDIRINGGSDRYRIGRSGPEFTVHAGVQAYSLALPAPKSPDALAAGAGSVAAGQLVAPMPGTVVKVNVSEGDRVQARQTLAVLDAMKMEHAIQAGGAGSVRRVLCAPGQRVVAGELLIEVDLDG